VIYRRIGVTNAGPFLGEWSVELPLGPTVVIARYEDSEVRSNRAGKSFFAVDAPMYALHGEFRGKRVDDFAHRLARGQEDAFVEVEIESSDAREWSIKRGRTAGGDPIRELNGSKISDEDLKRAVEREILGLTYDEYLNTNAFVQGEIHGFLKATPAEKRRIVSPWFRTDRWVPRADLARKRLNAARSDLRALDRRERELEEVLNDGDARAEELEGVVAELDRSRVEVDRAEERVRELKAAMKAEDEEQGRRRELERELEDLREEGDRRSRKKESDHRNAEFALTRAKQAVREARERDERVRTLEVEEEALRAVRDDLAKVRDEVIRLKRERDENADRRNSLLEKYKELEKTRTGVCPVLREACDRIEADSSVLDEIKREGLTTRRALERLEREIEAAEDRSSEASRFRRKLESSVDELEEARKRPGTEEAERNFAEVERKLKEASAALEREDPIERDLERLEKRIEEIPGIDARVVRDLAEAVERCDGAVQHRDDLERRAADARAAVAEDERAREQLDGIASEREEIRERISRLAWTSYAFGASGIPSRELENAFGVAEDAMNSVLEVLGTTLRLRFEPTRELKDGEPGCLACGEAFEKGERTHVCKVCGAPRRKRRRDELRLEVEDGGNESSFELDSGGGKVLLSLGARLGLATLPGAIRAVRCEHLLIDEPDGALDEPNRAALHGLLRRKMNDLGIRQVLLITHADVRREFDSVVTVHRWDDEDRSAVWTD